ncbi:hypothetical protein C8J57DRAFT_1516784 [Mycena rebaudengoi]|nr:hypothetical protein C8J57DRAFT_1516784 [Mycena rebaudengoi]
MPVSSAATALDKILHTRSSPPAHKPALLKLRCASAPPPGVSPFPPLPAVLLLPRPPPRPPTAGTTQTTNMVVRSKCQESDRLDCRPGGWAGEPDRLPSPASHHHQVRRRRPWSPIALMSHPSEHDAAGSTSPRTDDEQTSPYIDDIAVDAHTDDDTNVDEYDEYDDDDDSVEAQACRWDTQHFPVSQIVETQERRMQRTGAYLPPHIPNPRLQAPQQDQQQPQEEQQRQPRHAQHTPQQQSDFSDFSLLSNAFGAPQSRPPPTMLPNPSWLFASSSIPSTTSSGLQAPSQYAPAFGARTPYAGSPFQYQPSRPNSPFPAWMATFSSATAGASAQTPTFLPDYDDNWSALPTGAQTLTFTDNYDDSLYMPLPTRRQTPLFLPGSRNPTPLQPQGSMPPLSVPPNRQTPLFLPSSHDPTPVSLKAACPLPPYLSPRQVSPSSDSRPRKHRRLASAASRFLDIEAIVDEADDDDNEDGPTQADLNFLNDDEMNDEVEGARPPPEKRPLGRNGSHSAPLHDLDDEELRAIAARFDHRALEQEQRPHLPPTPIQPKRIQWARVKNGTYKGRLALITVPDEEYLVVPLPKEQMRKALVHAGRTPQVIDNTLQKFQQGLEFGLFKVNLKQQLAQKPGSKASDFLNTVNVSCTAEELAGFDQPHPRINTMCLDEPTSTVQLGDRVTIRGGEHAGKNGYVVIVYDLPSEGQQISTVCLIREAYNQYKILMQTARDGRSVGTGVNDDLFVLLSNVGHHILALPRRLEVGDGVIAIDGIWDCPTGHITNIDETIPNLGVAAMNSALADCLYSIPWVTVQPAPPGDEYDVPMNCLGLDFRLGDRFRIVRSDSTTRRAGLQHMGGAFQMVTELELEGTVGSFIHVASAGGWVTLQVAKDGLGPGVQLPQHSEEILKTGLRHGFRLPRSSDEIFIYVRIGLLSIHFDDSTPLHPSVRQEIVPLSTSCIPQSLRLVGRTVRTQLVVPESEREQDTRELTDAEKELSERVALNVGKRYEGHIIQIVGDHVEKTHTGRVIGDRDVANPDGTTGIALTVQLGNNRLVHIPLQHALHVQSRMLLAEAMKPGVIGGVGEVINLSKWEKTPPHSPSSADPDWGCSPHPPPPLHVCELDSLGSVDVERGSPPPLHPPTPIVDVDRGSWLAHRRLFGKRLDVKIVAVVNAFCKGDYHQIRQKQQLAEGQTGYLVIPPDSDLHVNNVNKRFVKPRLTRFLEYTLLPPCVHPIPPSGRELHLAATRVVIIGPDANGGGSRHFGQYAMIVPEPGGSSAQTARVRFLGDETVVFLLECLCHSTNEKTMGPTVAQATIF